jgi:hypothetical protein
MTYELEHAPCGLVRNPQLFSDLVSRDAAVCLGHEIHGREPGFQRKMRAVENGAGGRVEVVATAVTGVRSAAGDAVMLGLPLALVAENPLRIQVAPKPVQAGGVIRIFLFETITRKAIVGGAAHELCRAGIYTPRASSAEGIPANPNPATVKHVGLGGS